MADPARWLEIFWDIQRGLPRQGPGRDASTRQALSLCRGLPARPAIVDIGCGPGMQTVALATAANCHVTAVDLNREFLGELSRRATAANVAERIGIVAGDMTQLPFAPGSFDAIWSEGAAYIMGVAQALADWKRLLRPGGCVAVTELVWLQPHPPAEAATFFATGYPAMTDAESILAAVRACGYEPLGHFTWPDSAWWENYYTPLEAKLPALSGKYRADDEAMRMIETTRREIEVRRRFPDAYGYAFFVGRAVE